MKKLDWCWNCFSFGIEMIYDKWITHNQKIALESYDWLKLLKCEKCDYTLTESNDKIISIEIEIPNNIEYSYMMQYGFAFLFEEDFHQKIIISNSKILQRNDKKYILFEFE